MSNYTAVYTGVWLLLLMYLLRRWRHHRTDALRQTLFSLRDELFDFAADGKLDFKAPAYLVSRGAINSLIRFAHRITTSRFIFLLIGRYFKWYETERLFSAVSELPNGEAKSKIGTIHARMMIAIVVHLLTTSPAMCLLLLLFMLHLLTMGAIRKTSNVIIAFSRHVRVDLLENLAIEIEAGLGAE